MTGNPLLLVIVAGIMFAVLGGVTLLSHIYSLNGIKSKTVGDGQHGTARWATKAEIKKIYKHVPFDPQRWRKQAAKGQTPTGDDGKPLPQGIVVGCTGNTTAMVDTGDVHALMIGAAGVGKTAFWLYPCIEYACASGMSWLSTDTKGDVMRNYGHIAKQYGYNVSVIDLRNPTRSNGNNLLHLVNKYMDLYQQHPDTLVYKAKAEKYAKIISKTIILSGMDAASFGQNAYFYDAAEGLLTATILLVAEFCEPEKRHIVSVFKIIQELLAPSQKKGKNQFQQLMEMLPDDHKAKWFAGAALNTAEQSMASVMSTALSRLNSFLDSELEQLLCFDTEIDAEKFCTEKSAIFVVMPEENPNTFFMISLIIQQLYREILAVTEPCKNEPSIEVRQINNDISRMLGAPQIDKDALRKKMMECISQKYKDLDEEAHTARKLQADFDRADSEDYKKTLNRTVSEIILYTDLTVGIILLNGQLIRKE